MAPCVTFRVGNSTELSNFLIDSCADNAGYASNCYTERFILSKLYDESFEVTVCTCNFVYLSLVGNKVHFVDGGKKIHVIS